LNYLLDTCVWLRLVDSPETLSPAARDVLSDANQYPVGLATISIWEVARKESLGKLGLSKPSKEWLGEATRVSGIALLSLTNSIAWESCHLTEPFHRDPADQIIVATAKLQNLTLITTDRKIIEYPYVQTIEA
jgi:PIN domain nuclease of toxin-antitoxin system